SVELVAGVGSGDGLVSPTAIEYTGSPITFTESTQVKARVLKGGAWSAKNEATYSVGPVADNLRITEIMYHPLDAADPNEEFIELKNIGAETINLNLVKFTNGIDFTFPNMDLLAGGYVLVVNDQAGFEARHGLGLNVAGEYVGNLNNAGERIELQDACGKSIHNFSYKDGWYPITDGDGFSLTIIDAGSTDMNDWDIKDGWRPSAFVGGSPGEDDSGYVPLPDSVKINEVLAHSDTILYDWIELHNTTGSIINIGGWYLSDDDTDEAGLKKYEIPAGTSISANGYIVFYENLHFGSAFALSENGEKVCLTSAQGGVLTGYSEKEDFGASDPDVAFGRYYKASTDNYNFVAMSSNTPGWLNSAPLVGPIVINEIMYHPDAMAGGSYSDDEYEYIELYNISGASVTLYDPATSESWKFTEGIDYTFPAGSPVTIPAGGYIVVVSSCCGKKFI
ncbi:MAG: lamin tail domain-containing protein, partial [Planctomycetota bacterium]